MADPDAYGTDTRATPTQCATDSTLDTRVYTVSNYESDKREDKFFEAYFEEREAVYCIKEGIKIAKMRHDILIGCRANLRLHEPANNLYRARNFRARATKRTFSIMD